METKHFTKRALLISLLSVFVCCALLVGTTLAWFSDTVTNTSNRIMAGSLKVDLLMRGPSGNYRSIADGSGNIFDIAENANGTNKTLWEPGKTQVVYLAVKNIGNLALRYNILMDITDNGLADALDFAVIQGDQDSVIQSWASVASQAQNLGEHLATQGNRVRAVTDQRLDAANDTHYYALVVHMREDAGNNFQNKDIVIDVTVLAIQSPVESDSFDNQYDAGAQFPVSSTQELLDAVRNAKANDTILIAPGRYELPSDIDTAGLSLVGTVDESGNPLTTIVMNKQSDGLIRTIKIKKDNVRFSNINFVVPAPYNENTPVIMGDKSNLVVENCTFDGTGTTCCFIKMDGDGTIRNCTFIGGSTQVGPSNVYGTLLIENCTFNGATQYGIRIAKGTGNVIVRNCEIAAKTRFEKQLASVAIENCNFNDGGAGNEIMSEVDISLTNCVFDNDFKFLVGKNYNITITVNGCSSKAGLSFVQIVLDNNGKAYSCTVIENGTTHNIVK